MEVLLVLVKIGGTRTGTRKSSLPLWSLLHIKENYDPDWFSQWVARVPSLGCDCRVDFEKILEVLPPVYESSNDQFFRGIDWHNAVNQKLSRAEISYDQALTLWRHQRPKTSRTKCIVTVATGANFRSILEVTRPSIKSYAEKCDADFIELTNETELWWGFEKCRARHFVKQYEETLFVDADCVINPAAPSIFGRSDSLAMHDDYPYLPRTDWLHSERILIAKELGVAFEQRNTGLNSGVVYSRSEAQAIWTRPPANIPQTQTSEQTFVEQSAFRIGYSNLDSRWNWQIYFPGFWDEAKYAWIVHVAGEKKKLENLKRVLNLWG